MNDGSIFSLGPGILQAASLSQYADLLGVFNSQPNHQNKLE